MKLKEINKFKIAACVLIIAGMFTAGLFVGSIMGEKTAIEDDDIEFTAKEVMLLYQNGYYDGMNNILKHQKPNYQTYKKDSLYIINGVGEIYSTRK